MAYVLAFQRFTTVRSNKQIPIIKKFKKFKNKLNDYIISRMQYQANSTLLFTNVKALEEIALDIPPIGKKMPRILLAMS